MAERPSLVTRFLSLFRPGASAAETGISEGPSPDPSDAIAQIRANYEANLRLEQRPRWQYEERLQEQAAAVEAERRATVEADCPHIGQLTRAISVVSSESGCGYEMAPEGPEAPNEEVLVSNFRAEFQAKEKEAASKGWSWHDKLYPFLYHHLLVLPSRKRDYVVLRGPVLVQIPGTKRTKFKLVNAAVRNGRHYKRPGWPLLDISYILKRVIAMGFPGKGQMADVTHNRDDVYRFLESFHPGHYRVYNLCPPLPEYEYPAADFKGNVRRFPFDIHSVPPLLLIEAFCLDVKAWLEEHHRNVIVVHCKSGKGQTGLMIACLLVYFGMYPKEAIRLFNMRRQCEKPGGITIPSQRRWVYYFSRAIFCSHREPIENVIMRFSGGARIYINKVRLGPFFRKLEIEEPRFIIAPIKFYSPFDEHIEPDETDEAYKRRLAVMWDTKHHTNRLEWQYAPVVSEDRHSVEFTFVGRDPMLRSRQQARVFMSFWVGNEHFYFATALCFMFVPEAYSGRVPIPKYEVDGFSFYDRFHSRAPETFAMEFHTTAGKSAIPSPPEPVVLPAGRLVE